MKDAASFLNLALQLADCTLEDLLEGCKPTRLDSLEMHIAHRDLWTVEALKREVDADMAMETWDSQDWWQRQISIAKEWWCWKAWDEVIFCEEYIEAYKEEIKNAQPDG